MIRYRRSLNYKRCRPGIGGCSLFFLFLHPSIHPSIHSLFHLPFPPSSVSLPSPPLLSPSSTACFSRLIIVIVAATDHHPLFHSPTLLPVLFLTLPTINPLPYLFPSFLPSSTRGKEDKDEKNRHKEGNGGDDERETERRGNGE
jgi:hypothetical protein